MTRPTKAQLAAAARARKGRATRLAKLKTAKSCIPTPPIMEPPPESGEETAEASTPEPSSLPPELCVPSVAQAGDQTGAGREDIQAVIEVYSSDDGSVHEIEGDELRESLERGERSKCDSSTRIFQAHNGLVDWSQAEQRLRGVYTGNAPRTIRAHRQEAREKEKAAVLARGS